MTKVYRFFYNSPPQKTKSPEKFCHLLQQLLRRIRYMIESRKRQHKAHDSIQHHHTGMQERRAGGAGRILRPARTAQSH